MFYASGRGLWQPFFCFRPAIWSFWCQPTENPEKVIFVRSFWSVFRRLRRPSACISKEPLFSVSSLCAFWGVKIYKEIAIWLWACSSSQFCICFEIDWNSRWQRFHARWQKFLSPWNIFTVHRFASKNFFPSEILFQFIDFVLNFTVWAFS